MPNLVLVDKNNGEVINAVSSPNTGVKPQVEDEANQELMDTNRATFDKIMKAEYGYYNYNKKRFEPKEARKLINLNSDHDFKTGNVVFRFQQKDYDNDEVTEESEFDIEVDGKEKKISSKDGVLEFEHNFEEAKNTTITITSERYEEFREKIVVDYFHQIAAAHSEKEIQAGELTEVTFDWLKFDFDTEEYVKDEEKDDVFRVEIVKPDGEIFDTVKVPVNEELEFSAEEAGEYTIRTTNSNVENAEVKVVVEDA